MAYMDFVLILGTALLLDVLLGDPGRLPHPVAGIGRVIGFWEACLYPGKVERREGRRRGVLLCAAVLATTAASVDLLLLGASVAPEALFAVEVYLLYAALAWRSLKDETLPVAMALFRGDLDAARSALSRVVGRDTDVLDEAGMVRAAVETVAENSVDGVLSVLFFAALGYVAGGCVAAVLSVWTFKAVSTLDSMVGYENERYRDFGWASARLDDILNFLPARIGGLVAALAGACLGYPLLQGLRILLRDRRKHRSPNSAHGESAFAGLLGIRLGGGGVYGGVLEERPWLGDAVRDPEPEDILRAHALLDAAVALFVLLALLALHGLA